MSIVLPTRDGARHLRQALESCLRQTHRRLEVVVVDDGSTDETPGILDSVDDRRLIRVRHPRSLGLPASLNAGFARARGEYLTWTSDDNWYQPDAIERMLAFLHDRGADFARCDYLVIDEDRAGPPQHRRLEDEARFEQGNPVGACFLYSRRVAETVGSYDEGCVLAEDYDYWIRVSRHFALHHLDQPLYTYRLHHRSLTSRAARGRTAEAAASLVRLKHGLTTIEAEADRLGRELGYRRYGAEPRVLRAVTRVLRVATAGQLDLLSRVHLPGAVAECRGVLELFLDGVLDHGAATEKLGQLFLGHG